MSQQDPKQDPKNEHRNENKKDQTPETIRLDSLSGRSGPSSLRGGSQNPSSTSSSTGKFVPKAVARRSKQEREAALKASKQSSANQEKHEQGDRRGHNKLPQNKRKSRADLISATTAVGPLAAPSSYDPRAVRRFQPEGSAYLKADNDTRSRRQGEAMLAQLGRIKTDDESKSRSNSGSPAPHNDQHHRIDISTFEPVESEIAAQFPVRPAHDTLSQEADGHQPEHEHHTTQLEPDDTEKQEQQKLLEDYKALATLFFSTTKTKAEDEPEDGCKDKDHKPVKIKKEPTDDNHFDSTVGSTADNAMDIDSVAPQAEDHTKLIFLQLPLVLPKFESKPKPTDQSQTSQDDDLMIIDGDNANTKSEAVKKPTGLFPHEGRVGTLRRHKSGKVTMLFGDTVMDVTQGTECNYLQDVVAYDPSNKSAYQLGQVQQRIIAMPDMAAVFK